jgi:LuxR family maltose regulon positive regulatory protein
MLNDAAEGWVAGLQLAAWHCGKAPTGTARTRSCEQPIGIDTYLDGTVFSQLPREILEFTLRVSILDRMSAGACDAIMGAGARSWEKLDWLDRHNIFTRALDIDRHWFRFHALMVDAFAPARATAVE